MRKDAFKSVKAYTLFGFYSPKMNHLRHLRHNECLILINIQRTERSGSSAGLQRLIDRLPLID